MYEPGVSNVTSVVTRPSDGIVGATQTGAHGELAPARVSSHALICTGLNVTFPSPRYTNHDRWRPTFLPTVTRAGGSIARFARTGLSGFVSADAVSRRDPGLLTAEPARPAPRRLGMPSSMTIATIERGSPTRTVR